MDKQYPWIHSFNQQLDCEYLLSVGTSLGAGERAENKIAPAHILLEIAFYWRVGETEDKQENICQRVLSALWKNETGTWNTWFERREA